MTNPDSPAAGRRIPWTKLAVLVLVVAAFVVAFTQFRAYLSLDSLADKEAALQQFRTRNPVLVYCVAFLIYVLVTGLSLPGAAVLTLTFAWFFGFWRAVVLVSFASTTGATLAFLVSRYLFRDFVQTRFDDRLTTFNRRLEKEGAFYLFTLRLIPAVPFFVINAVMGLTPIATHTFWWVSQVGMLPGTCVYVYAGNSVPDLNTLAEKGTSGILSPQLFVAFVLLGVFPLAVKKIMQRVRPGQADQQETES